MTPPALEHISHYELLEPLGRGAMGEVWLAQDTQLPRKVAVKLLPRHMAEDGDAVARLLREAQAAASVDHPGVVAVYEAGVHDGRPYLVMQRVEGETLEARLVRGPLTVSEAVKLGIEVADALAEVHALGIVHRDLKPSNVILSPRGARVLDFGVASVKGSPKLTTTGLSLGTPLAMAPEQMRGQPPDNRTDLWALGVMLYGAVTGTPPFTGASMEQVMHSVLNTQPKPPGALRAGVPPELDFIVMKLLRKDAAHRYARAEELLADLRSCAAGLTGAAPAAASSTATTGTPSLAVLPFELMSADADDAFLAAGLAEDLIVDLTRVGDLHVSTRAETAGYKNRSVPPRTVARELGVDYVLIGSVRRAGNRARISTQLVRASDGHALWAERFDRTLEDLFDVQAEVSKRIVDALQIELKPGEREMLDRAPTRSAEAYQLYLRARAIMDMGRAENMQAEELLRQALALDPDFALGLAALGETYARRAMRWWTGLDIVDKALPFAEQALAREPGLLEAKLVQAMAHRLRGEVPQLLAMLDRLLEIAPDHPELNEWAAWSYMSSDQPQRALVLLKRQVERHPDNYRCQSWLWQCYDMMGRVDEMKRQAQVTLETLMEAVRRHPDDTYARSLLAAQLILAGETAAGVAQAERTLEISPHDGRLRYNAACAFARAGLPERAIAELKEGVRQVPSYISDWPRRDPDLASLHDHPEFIAMFGKAES
jgi:TolB-like protein/Flp pilus assembly protein TadD/predicted Ser/Thr protein kinase